PVSFAAQKTGGDRARPGTRACRGGNPVHLLGAIFAVLSAATFALTNATGRRGVITGTPAQGMVTSIPVGLLCFLAVAFVTGALADLNRITASMLASLSAAGVIH